MCFSQLDAHQGAAWQEIAEVWTKAVDRHAIRQHAAGMCCFDSDDATSRSNP
jgi:hypothetical protein